MANTNFTVVMGASLVAEFKATVIEAAASNGVSLTERTKLGTSQVWSLGGYSPMPNVKRCSVIGYETGSVVFQGLNPKSIGIDARIVGRWGNTP